MWMIFLYGLATFMETGIGIWMFGKMFPERESSSDCKLARRILLTLLILTTYTMRKAYGKEYVYEKYFFILAYIVFMLLDIILCKHSSLFRLDKRTQKVALFMYISIMLTWQYWVSYVSFGAIILANLYVPFFLLLFYECDFIQSYLWEVLYLVNIGFTKILFVYIVGLVKHRKVDQFLFSKSMHFYISGIYLFLICVIFLLLQKAFRVEIWMSKLLKQHKRLVAFVVLSECGVLYILMSMNWGYIENRDLVINLIVVSGIALVLLFIVVHFFTKSVDAEKNILEVRINIIASQYEELKENYKRYRCLIHDEKHMINYIDECIRTENFSEIQNIIKKNKNKFSERYYWTGITALDNVISIEKRKMDNINIEFHIEANVVDMVMEDIDIIILLENLFDNAIEAVEKCNDRKEIRFNIRNVNSMLILKIWNCSCKMPEVKKDRFITDKNDSKGHGWGLESVKYIVQKYNGSIEFEYGETFFEVIIIIGGE